MNLHMDLENGYEYLRDGKKYIKDENGNKIIAPRQDYKFHFDSDLNSQDPAKLEAFTRYNQAKAIMNDNLQDAQYAAAHERSPLNVKNNSGYFRKRRNR